MHCYIHQSVSAVGICKNCFKALCPSCAVEITNGLTCHGDCEQKVDELNQMWDRSAKIYGIGRHKTRMPPSGVILWGMIAVGLWTAAGQVYYKTGQVDSAIVAIASMITVMFGLAIYSARRTGLKC